MAEYIHWNRFLGSLEVNKFGLWYFETIWGLQSLKIPAQARACICKRVGVQVSIPKNQFRLKSLKIWAKARARICKRVGFQKSIPPAEVKPVRQIELSTVVP